MSEQPGLLVAGGEFDVRQLELWRNVAQNTRGTWCHLSLLDSIETEQDLTTIDLSTIAGEQVKISVQYVVAEGAAHLLTIEGLRALLALPQGLNGISVVRVATEFQSFRTRAILFEPWTVAPTGAPIRQLAEIEKRPQRYVRSLVASQVVPSEAEPWLLAEEVPETSNVLSVWKEAARDWMVRTFVDEIFQESDSLIAAFHGPPTRRLTMGKAGPLLPLQFEAVAAAAQWIFGEGPDVEVRHTLLANELARNWPNTATYFDTIFSILELSLDGARTAYRAHLRSGSRETIRALAELRRTLIDEVQRVSQQTRDLAASLWRDVAIAIGAAAFRAVLDLVKSDAGGVPNKSAPAEKIYAFVLIATIIYLVASLLMSALVNRRFLRIAARNRSTWQSKLYAFLSDDEFESLAGETIRKSVGAYHLVLWSSWVVTVLVCGLLASLAIHTGWGDLWAFLADTRSLLK